jgi:hypothetical protein
MPRAIPPQTKRVSVGVSKPSSRSILMAAVGKNASQGSVDLEQTDKNSGDSTPRHYFSEPQTLDVCCGRGKGSFRQPGNLIFHDVIRNHLDTYLQADSRTSKSAIVSVIVNSLVVDHKLRFIKKDPTVGKWYALSIPVCHEKTGHAIRDQLKRMRRTQSPLQTSSSTPTTISCSSSVSSTDAKKKIVKKKIIKVVGHKIKHQVHNKKIKKSTISQQQEMIVDREEQDLMRFHLVSPEEEDDPWSDHISCTEDNSAPSLRSWGDFLGTDILFPSPSSGDDDIDPLDFHQYDDLLAKAVLDQQTRLSPQEAECTLPNRPPAISRQFSHGMVHDRQAPLRMIPTYTIPSLPRVTPENNGRSYALPSNHSLFVVEEGPLDPIHALYVPTSYHGVSYRPEDCKLAFLNVMWNFDAGHMLGSPKLNAGLLHRS